MQGVRTYFRKPYSWLGVTAIDASADAITIFGDVTFICVSGNIWINPEVTAVANTTAIKLVPGDTLEFVANGTTSIISDGSGGTYQYIVWE